MADTVRLVEYFYVMAPQKAGVGASLLTELRQAGVNLLAFTGFPSGRGAQVDFVPEDPAAFRAAARKAKWKVTGPKRALLIEGDDRPGAIADVMQRLADCWSEWLRAYPEHWAAVYPLPWHSPPRPGGPAA